MTLNSIPKRTNIGVQKAILYSSIASCCKISIFTFLFFLLLAVFFCLMCTNHFEFAISVMCRTLLCMARFYKNYLCFILDCQSTLRTRGIVVLKTPLPLLNSFSLSHPYLLTNKTIIFQKQTRYRAWELKRLTFLEIYLYPIIKQNGWVRLIKAGCQQQAHIIINIFYWNIDTLNLPEFRINCSASG